VVWSCVSARSASRLVPRACTPACMNHYASPVGGEESPQPVISGLEPLLSIETLAEYVGVPVVTIYRWRTEGKGPCATRIGRHLKFALSDVQAWLGTVREAAPGGERTSESAPVARPRLPVGAFGEISTRPVGNGRFRARVRYRDTDGRNRQLEAHGSSAAAAKRRLRLKMAAVNSDRKSSAEVTGDTACADPVAYWLDGI